MGYRVDWMSDFSEMKRLAQRVIDIEAADGDEPIGEAWDEFEAVATPSAVLPMIAEIERLRTAEGDAMTYKAGMENVAQQRDQLKAELEKVKADRKACWEEFKIQGRQLDQLKQENRLLTEHNEFLASSDSRLAPELRAVKDALGLDFTASVSGGVVPAIEKLREDADKWKIVERAMAQLQSDEQGAAIWSACSRILISVAGELNSARSTVTEEGVTFGGVEIGDWRVTVERIDVAMGK